MTLSQINNELQTLKSGERLIYHTGFLAKDRKTISHNPDKIEKAKNINEMGNYLYGLQKSGFLYLIQNKKSVNLYDYYAIKA